MAALTVDVETQPVPLNERATLYCPVVATPDVDIDGETLDEPVVDEMPGPLQV